MARQKRKYEKIDPWHDVVLPGLLSIAEPKGPLTDDELSGLGGLLGMANEYGELYPELRDRYQRQMSAPRRGEHRSVSPFAMWLQEQSDDLLRPADFIPGPQQAMATKDLADARRMTEQAEGLTGKGLGYGMQGLSLMGMLPLVGGVTGPGRSAARKALNKAAKENALGILDASVAASLSPYRGGAVTGERGLASAPFTRTPLVGGPRRSAPGSLGGIGIARYDINAPEIGQAGLSTSSFIELADTPEARKTFRNKGRTAARLQGDAGKQVDIYKDPDDYTGARLFLSEDGKSGFAIKPDGDIVSVFKNPGTPGAAWGSVATALATQEGGRKLDAFDTFLPSSVYGPIGYEHRAGAQFNPEYKPLGWDEETMGRPNVSAMSYSPGGANYAYPPAAGDRGISVPNLFGPEGYGQALAVRDASPVFAGEMTPGVARQLHEAVPRMGQAVDPPVPMAPEGLMYPGIYKAPEQIVREGLAKIAPENPNLKKYFGLTRAELDEATRAAQGTQTADLPVPRGDPDGVGLEAGLLANPDNAQRLRDTMALAASEPGFAGSYGWYYTNPLRDRFVKEFGDEEGARRFDRLMQASSVMSANSPVDLELRRASLWQMDPERFTNADLSSGQKVFAEYPELFSSAEDAGRYAAMYHKGTQRPGLQRLQDTGYAFDPQPAQQIKTKNYYESKMGTNYQHPTMDAHFVRGIGLPDTRVVPGAGGSIKGPEAEIARDFFEQQVAEPLGMKGSPAQALMWNVMAPQTGVKTKVGKPYLELLIDGAEREAKRRGKTVDQVLDEFVRGKGLLSRVQQDPGLMYG